MPLQRIVYPDSPSALFEQYYSTTTGKRLGGILIYHIYTHVVLASKASHTRACRDHFIYILYISLIGLLDSNYELYQQEWTVIVHHRGYFI
jgi:hypothetical protein